LGRSSQPRVSGRMRRTPAAIEVSLPGGAAVPG
jgi:hypothetical protein